MALSAHDANVAESFAKHVPAFLQLQPRTVRLPQQTPITASVPPALGLDTHIQAVLSSISEVITFT